MGIKHFFRWFRTQFHANIVQVPPTGVVNTQIDNLMIDMNGIIHTAAQKVYKYGNFKPAFTRLLVRKETSLKQQIEVFEGVCDIISQLIQLTKPTTRVVLCIDGTAPLSKQNQQRQRRFRSAVQNEGITTFDQNAITPGTKFMDYLSKYIDWYIRKNLPSWGNLEIIFSSEKNPGEGEHKLINYMRKYGVRDQSYCIHGMDADLIMLALGTHYPKMYILRDNQIEPGFNYFLLDIGTIHGKLASIMQWEGEFKEEYAINDFILMCFSVGNDFLPHVPALAIIEGGIEIMLDVYKNVCKSYGHLTKKKQGKTILCRKNFQVFLGTLAQYEKGALEQKLKNRDKYFPDELMERHLKDQYQLDLEAYKEEYYKTHFPTDPKEVCHQYIRGMSWVLTYYLHGVPDWNWCYPYNYAPFASTLAQHMKSCSLPDYVLGQPRNQYVQLLCVLPPKSAHLLPPPLSNLLKEPPLSQYCPEELTIDVSGCRQEWEGVVILPNIRYDVVEEEYNRVKHLIPDNEKRRNTLEKSKRYNLQPNSYLFKSFYGDMETPVKMSVFDL